jgi:hypothetical protein
LVECGRRWARDGGSLSHIWTDDLLGRTMVAACERVSVPLDRVEDIAATPSTASSADASIRPGRSARPREPIGMKGPE